MGGGLLQLVAYGAQDVYLTGNPQITFFKVVYRRHTNFALEAIEQTFNGNPAFGQRVTCQISRNGDLIHRTYLVVTLSNGDEIKAKLSVFDNDEEQNNINIRINKDLVFDLDNNKYTNEILIDKLIDKYKESLLKKYKNLR